MSDITRLLVEMAGDREAATARILPLVYDELRMMAKAQLRQEKPGHTLQSTALVHEAFLRLIGSGAQGSPAWQNRRVFFAAAAEAMRRILIESARRHAALKRGGDRSQVPVDLDQIQTSYSHEELLAVHEVLDRLATIDPDAAELVKLRFFLDWNMSEIAEALGISVRTAQNLWAYSKAWLRDALGD